MDAQIDLRNGRLFMEEARAAQLESGASMRGRPGLKEAQRLAIRATSPRCTIAAAPLEASSEIKTGLLERFEKMCRRQHIEVPAELRPAILERLLMELWVNQRALKERADKLVPVTAYSGAVGPKLSKEFAAFRDTPSIFRQAAVGNPGDPRAWLRSAPKSDWHALRVKHRRAVPQGSQEPDR